MKNLRVVSDYDSKDMIAPKETLPVTMEVAVSESTDEVAEVEDAEEAVSEGAQEEASWEDVMGAVYKESGVEPSKPEESSESSSEDEKEQIKPQEDKPSKKTRMTTNKKKATNFFTTANVKNRNRDKKVGKKISK
jgi:nuclear GTP-binding protein